MDEQESALQREARSGQSQDAEPPPGGRPRLRAKAAEAVSAAWAVWATLQDRLPRWLYVSQPVLFLLPPVVLFGRLMVYPFSYAGAAGFLMPLAMLVGQALFWYLTWGAEAQTGRRQLGRSWVPFAVYLAAAAVWPLSVVADTAYAVDDVYAYPSALMLVGASPGASRTVASVCTVTIMLAGGASLLVARAELVDARLSRQGRVTSPHGHEGAVTRTRPGDAGGGTGSAGTGGPAGQGGAAQRGALLRAAGRQQPGHPGAAGRSPGGVRGGGPANAAGRWLRRLQQATPRTAWLATLLPFVPVPFLEPAEPLAFYLFLAVPVLLAAVVTVALLVALQVRRAGLAGPFTAVLVHTTVLLAVVGLVLLGLPSSLHELPAVASAASATAGTLACLAFVTPCAVVLEVCAPGEGQR